jgi:hypothetical protein
MATIKLRVRLVGGDHLDVTFEGPARIGEEQVAEHVITTLSQDNGVIRAEHNAHLVVLYGRGVAAIEVASMDAVL